MVPFVPDEAAAARIHDKSFFKTGLHNETLNPFVLLERFSGLLIGNELNSDHQSLAPNVADDRAFI